VAAESDGVGHGSTFRVELPLRVEDVPGPGESLARARTTDQTLAGVRALVVDDDADATELSRYVLESRGASVVTSGSAGEALDLLAGGRYDILIADIGMPDQDGLALIRAVRNLPAHAPNRDIPAITLTAFGGLRERDEALAAGFTAHLAKPIDPDRLIHIVSTSAARHDPE
jgi:CheY-like chemotaxis protein